jgi:phosphatidylserine/phosphatidylglycerophosphate/cardiolipin synthase-like enzyme
MVKVRFFGGQFWNDITTAAKGATRREVAVAFLTTGAVKRLPLEKGDTLVVNAGDRALRSGSTQAAQLAVYLKKGVQLYSCADLHGKGFLFDETAIVGSTNVSELSYNDLHEAALLTREPKAVAGAREFVQNLPRDVVDQDFLKRAAKI